MSDLCTACLSVGRNLFSVQGSDIQQLYTQILNEISISGEMLSACMQVCWECRAVLERFQRFKRQAQECYTELLDNMQQSTPYNHHRSRLGTRRVHSISYPEPSSATSELRVKCELEVKCELSDDTHREPDTFVDSVAPDREPRTAKEKRTLKKKSKHKVKIRKKKREVRSKESSDAGSDADFDDATESFTKREFPCAQCDESFVEERELERHIDRLHIVKTLKRKSKQKVKIKKKKAARSKESSDTASDVDFEETESLAKREFACAQCDESFVEERELERHTDSVHTVKTLKKESSDAGYDVDFEETESLAKREFPCAQCEESFVEERELERHIDSSHIVEKAVKRNGVRRPRNMEPLPEKPQCVECGKMFSSRKTYRYHLNVLHRGQNRYPCPRCGKVYQWKSNLGRHMRTHKARDNNELHCALCDKRFASVATYRQHLRVSRRHVSENDFTFMCNECGKKFVNKTRLRDHIDWEHLNKIKFRCQLCNKPFKCHTSLYVHLQNVHKNKEKKENLCHVCGKSYPNAAKLKYHIVAMHTSETPYRCAQCGAAFGWYSSLYRHVREVHHKMKLQPNRIRKQKIPKPNDLLPPLLGPS